jgi:hypothetical protein
MFVTSGGQDVLQVCRNGHVITDLLRTHPELGRSHCDRCGAATLTSCPTCGWTLPGALAVPGLEPIGQRRPPRHCEECGAAFPWVREAVQPASGLADLVLLLHRLPRTIRQLRVRQGERMPFRVEDERDLEDLLRAVLPLRFDDIRQRLRTPRYAPGTRTDFLLAAESIAVAIKQCRPEVRAPQLAEQVREDVEHYRQQRCCDTLVVFVYDPEGHLPEARLAWSDERWSEPEVVCVVAGCNGV